MAPSVPPGAMRVPAVATLALAVLLLSAPSASAVLGAATGHAVARYTGHDVAVLSAHFVAHPDPLSPGGILVEFACTATALEAPVTVRCDVTTDGGNVYTDNGFGLHVAVGGTLGATNGSPGSVRVCASIVGSPLPPACATDLL